jgi:beta-glucosidase
MTQGYQGKRLKNKDSLAACIKHFAAYGAALAGRDYAQASLSLHDFYQQYDAGYRGAVDAGVRMAMTSFNVFEGIPATIHQTLLRKVLRKRMGFKGVTISDYDSIIETVVHRVSKDDQDAVRQALLATVDIEMASGAYIKHIPTLVQHGLIDIELIDQAVLRVLKLKKDLGLFQNPFKGAHIEKEKSLPLSAPQLAIAKTLADESIVLLKNHNHVLPLGNQKIALVGHLSNSGALLGPWSWHGNREITPSLNAVLKPFVQTAIEDTQSWSETIQQQVKLSEVIVVMTGEEEKESGEARSKTNPVLADITIQFIKQLKVFGKPIVLIVTAGRPLVLTSIVDDVDAILYAYFLGSQAAFTITDTLLGKNNPSAKLTMTFPRRVGQIPIMYNHLNTGRPFLGQNFTYTSHYIDESNLPLFTFGDGLSYTTFAYSDFKDVSSSDDIQFSIHVKNTGTRAGYAIVPVYLIQPFAPVALPNRQLVGMEKRFLEPQETQTFIIKIDRQFLTYIDSNYQRQNLNGKLMFETGQSTSLLHVVKEIN